MFKAVISGLLLVLNAYGSELWRTTYYYGRADLSGQLPISEIPWSKYTHVIQYYIVPTFNTETNMCGLDVSTYDVGRTSAAFVDSAHANNVKALVGMIQDNGATAMQTCTRPPYIAEFVSAIAAFVKGNEYDGFDIDWEAGIVESQYEDFIVQLRAAMPDATLTVAALWNQRKVFARQQEKLDQINYMLYDLDLFSVHGAPLAGTAFNTALFQDGHTAWVTADVVEHYMVQVAGVSPARLGFGIPFYGRIKRGCRAGYLNGGVCTQGVTGPDQPYATGTALTNPRQPIGYSKLLHSQFWTGGTYFWDRAHGAEYISFDVDDPAQDAFVTFTGPSQLVQAIRYALTNAWGGIMTYDLVSEYAAGETGDRRYPLSTVMYDAVRKISAVGRGSSREPRSGRR